MHAFICMIFINIILIKWDFLFRMGLDAAEEKQSLVNVSGVIWLNFLAKDIDEEQEISFDLVICMIEALTDGLKTLPQLK